MVNVPDTAMAKHVIELAKEFGEYGEVYDTVAEGRHGEHEFDAEWSLNDMNPSDCAVDMIEEGVLRVSDTIEATYQVQIESATYYPNSKAHPAEYETRTIDLEVYIDMEISELGVPVINAEPY